MATPTDTPRTLAIDIGGSGIKAAVLDPGGAMITERVRIATPPGAAPPSVVDRIAALVEPLRPFDRVSVGFPGVVRGSVIRTAVNLGHDDWIGFDLGAALRAAFGCPVRVANDADLQGFGAIRGVGVEMVATLGTGFGTGIYEDGRLGPHLELAHHPFRKGETYEEQLGNAARKRIGNERWSGRVLKAVDTLRTLLHFDHMYLGGGNAKKLTVELPSDVSTVSNRAGITGGIALWRD